MSQVENVREHLNKGLTITPLEALDNYGCFRLAAIIHILRDEGMLIESELVNGPNGKRYAEYKLI